MGGASQRLSGVKALVRRTIGFVPVCSKRTNCLGAVHTEPLAAARASYFVIRVEPFNGLLDLVAALWARKLNLGIVEEPLALSTSREPLRFLPLPHAPKHLSQCHYPLSEESSHVVSTCGQMERHPTRLSQPRRPYRSADGRGR
jgi:hypothetical protein